jgi:V-type H+-transporting ATPase subunit d
MPAWDSVRHWKVSYITNSYLFGDSFWWVRIIDFRTQLSASDYATFLANEPSPLSTSTIADKATKVLVDQFNYLRSNSVQPLSKFLDYLTYVP